MQSFVPSIALIGCGGVSELLHAPAIKAVQRAGRCKVVAVVDPKPERRALIASDFPGSLAVASLDELPHDTHLAIVASPLSLHVQHACELLGRGMHVLCEKPMAMDVAECDRMIEVAKAANRLLGVGLVRRFFPTSRQVRGIIESAALGRPLRFRMFEGARYQWAAVSDAYFRKQAGGGALRDVGVHLLDLMLWWFGEPESVDYRDDAMGGVEASCRIRLAYACGLEGEVRLSRDANFLQQYFIEFERGWISTTPNGADRLELGLSGDLALCATVHEQYRVGGHPFSGRRGSSFHQAFIAQICNAIGAVNGEEPLVVSGEEGRRSVHFVESCYASRKLLEMDWMTERERERGAELQC